MRVEASSGSGGGGVHKTSVSIPSGESTITINELTNIDSVCWQLNTGTQGNDDNFYGAIFPSLYSGYLKALSPFMTNTSTYNNYGVRGINGNQITFYWSNATTIDLYVTGT